VVVVKAAGALSGWFVGAMGVSGRAAVSFVGTLTQAVVLTVAVVEERRGVGGQPGRGWERLRAFERGGELFWPGSVAREAQDFPAGVAGNPPGLV
jgi:hypothetical protein